MEINLLLKMMHVISYENSHIAYFKNKDMQFSNLFIFFHWVLNTLIRNIKIQHHSGL